MKTNSQFSVKSLIVQILFSVLICCGFITLITRTLIAQSNSDYIFKDYTFSPADWKVYQVSENGASQTFTQELIGGHPGAFRLMQHILPAPAGDLDIASIGTAHIYQNKIFKPSQSSIWRIDYSEDIKLTSLPFPDAFITSTLALEQDSIIYFSHSFYSNYIAGDTTWHAKSIFELVADDFIPILHPESPQRPDFSINGSPIKFGYYRYSYRMRSFPDYPLDQDLIIEHGIDNWLVLINGHHVNRPPIAYDDYVSLREGAWLNPAANDEDPDGDFLYLVDVGPNKYYGHILDVDSMIIHYEPKYFMDRWMPEPVSEYDEIPYKVTDKEFTDSATCYILPCSCLLDVMFYPACLDYLLHLKKPNLTTISPDSFNLGLFYQFRDDVLQHCEHGDSAISKYYQYSTELVQLVIIDRPDLRDLAAQAVYMLQNPIFSLVNGDSSAVVSQALVDTLGAFLDSLSVLASPDLRTSLQEEMERWGPLDDLVGKPVTEAVTDIFGNFVTGIKTTKVQPANYSLGQNYPNPFNASTVFQYSLPRDSDITIQIYNILGKEVRTLYRARQQAGSHRCTWNSLDDAGVTVPSGVYVITLKADRVHLSRKILLLK